MAFPAQNTNVKYIHGYNKDGIAITSIFPSGESYNISQNKEGRLELIPEMVSPPFKCYSSPDQDPFSAFEITTSENPGLGQVYISQGTGAFKFNEFESAANVYFFYTGYGSYVRAEDFYNPIASGLDEVQTYARELGEDFVAHDHDDSYYTKDQVDSIVAGFEPSGDYATVSQVEAKEDAITVGASGQYFSWDKTWRTITPSSIGAQPAGDYADASHDHDGAYYTKSQIDTSLSGKEPSISSGTTSQFWRGDKSWVEVTPQLIGAQPSGEYLTPAVSSYLQSEIDTKADSSHNHDSDYYTKSQLDSALAGKENFIEPSSGNVFFRGDKTWAEIDLGAKEDLLPSGEPDTFLRSDKTWVSITPSSIGAQPSGDFVSQSKHDEDYNILSSGIENHTHDERYFTQAQISGMLEAYEPQISGSDASKFWSGAKNWVEITPETIGAQPSGEYLTPAASSFLQSEIDGKANTAHAHDDRYYTKGQVDIELGGKESVIPSGTTNQFWRGDKVWAQITPASIGAQSSGDYATNTSLSLVSGVLQDSIDEKEPAISVGASGYFFRADKTWAQITPSLIGAMPSSGGNFSGPITTQGNTVWTSANFDPSGVNALYLGGYLHSDFAKKSSSETITSSWTFASGVVLSNSSLSNALVFSDVSLYKSAAGTLKVSGDFEATRFNVVTSIVIGGGNNISSVSQGTHIGLNASSGIRINGSNIYTFSSLLLPTLPGGGGIGASGTQYGAGWFNNVHAIGSGLFLNASDRIYSDAPGVIAANCDLKILGSLELPNGSVDFGSGVSVYRDGIYTRTQFLRSDGLMLLGHSTILSAATGSHTIILPQRNGTVLLSDYVIPTSGSISFTREDTTRIASFTPSGNSLSDLTIRASGTLAGISLYQENALATNSSLYLTAADSTVELGQLRFKKTSNPSSEIELVARGASSYGDIFTVGTNRVQAARFVARGSESAAFVAYGFKDLTSYGFYSAAANQINIALSSAEHYRFTTASFHSVAPTITVGANNSRFFWDAPNTRLLIGHSSSIANSSIHLAASAGAFIVNSAFQWWWNDGSIYPAVNNDINLGTDSLRWATVFANQIQSTGRVLGGLGVVTQPTFSFENDIDTGIYRAGSNNLGIAAAGVEIARFNQTGVQFYATARFQSGSIEFPSLTFDAQTSLGFYRKRADVLGFSCNNQEILLMRNESNFNSFVLNPFGFVLRGRNGTSTVAPVLSGIYGGNGASAASAQKGGGLDIVAGEGGFSASADGQGGDVYISGGAAASVYGNGTGGSVRIAAGVGSASDGNIILSAVSGVGAAGNIQMEAASIQFDSGQVYFNAPVTIDSPLIFVNKTQLISTSSSSITESGSVHFVTSMHYSTSVSLPPSPSNGFNCKVISNAGTLGTYIELVATGGKGFYNHARTDSFVFSDGIDTICILEENGSIELIFVNGQWRVIGGSGYWQNQL